VKVLKLCIIVFILAVLSCVEYEEKISVKADGSGSMTVHYMISESMLKLAQEDGMPLTFDKDEIEQELKSDKVKVESVEAYTEDEKRHIVTKLTFKDINDLPDKWVFQDREMSFSSEGDHYTFRSVFSMAKDKKKAQGTEPQQAEELGAFGEQFAEALFGDYTFTFSIEMPGEVVEASPEAVIEHNVVVWEFSLARLSDMKQIEMTVKAKKPAAIPILLIVVLVLVIIVVVIVIVWRITRKK
jgi:cobalamin biosynthesis Mg chelatase CobN